MKANTDADSLQQIHEQPSTPLRKTEQPKDGVTSSVNKITRLAVFASGAGSNAAKIIEHFNTDPKIKVALIVCNKPGAGVLHIASNSLVPVMMITNEQFFRGNGYVDELRAMDIALLVLAGFLWKIPQVLIDAYPQKIINIHPALLPLHGGKGMYGERVHASVLTAGEKESGITIHYVNEQYDAGDIIFQARCVVEPTDTATTLAQKVHALEHHYYPLKIEEIVQRLGV